MKVGKKGQRKRESHISTKKKNPPLKIIICKKTREVGGGPG